MQNVILARKLDLLVDLYNGDPLSWGILIVVVVCSIGWSMYKNRKSGAGQNGNPE